MLITPELLKECRESIGFTKTQVAKATGLSRPTIIKLENGKNRSLEVLSRLIEYYGLEVYPRIGAFSVEIDEIERMLKKQLEEMFPNYSATIKIELQHNLKDTKEQK